MSYRGAIASNIFPDPTTVPEFSLALLENWTMPNTTAISATTLVKIQEAMLCLLAQARAEAPK